MPKNATPYTENQSINPRCIYFLRPSVPFLIILCLLESTSLSKISRAVSPFLRFEGLVLMLTVEAPPPRICFSASSQVAAPLSISYLETRNQLWFIRDLFCSRREKEVIYLSNGRESIRARCFSRSSSLTSSPPSRSSSSRLVSRGLKRSSTMSSS